LRFFFLFCTVNCVFGEHPLNTTTNTSERTVKKKERKMDEIEYRKALISVGCECLPPFEGDGQQLESMIVSFFFLKVKIKKAEEQSWLCHYFYRGYVTPYTAPHTRENKKETTPEDKEKNNEVADALTVERPPCSTQKRRRERQVRGRYRGVGERDEFTKHATYRRKNENNARQPKHRCVSASPLRGR
jgi:hypothetical protein